MAEEYIMSFQWGNTPQNSSSNHREERMTNDRETTDKPLSSAEQLAFHFMNDQAPVLPLHFVPETPDDLPDSYTHHMFGPVNIDVEPLFDFRR